MKGLMLQQYTKLIVDSEISNKAICEGIMSSALFDSRVTKNDFIQILKLLKIY